MIKTITGFTHALERRPSSARRLLPETESLADEETLRDWIMFILGSNFEAPDGGEVFIGGEVENGKGKTDTLVRHAGRNAFIGECKFWHGRRNSMKPSSSCSATPPGATRKRRSSCLSPARTPPQPSAKPTDG
jgi:hypothetical protein